MTENNLHFTLKEPLKDPAYNKISTTVYTFYNFLPKNLFF